MLGMSTKVMGAKTRQLIDSRLHETGVIQASPEVEEVSETIEGTTHVQIDNESPDSESHDIMLNINVHEP